MRWFRRRLPQRSIPPDLQRLTAGCGDMAETVRRIYAMSDYQEGK